MDSVSSKFSERTDLIFAFWLAVGLFFILAGMYIIPERRGYKSVFYLMFLLPSLILLVRNFFDLRNDFFRGSTIFFVVFMSYLTLSTLWGNPEEFPQKFKRLLYILVTTYGIFWLYVYKKEFFFKSAFISLIAVSSISAFWMFDFYVLSDIPFNKRFLAGDFDYYDLYRSGFYGSFYNPLLLSHSISFLLVLAVIMLMGEDKFRFNVALSLIVCVSVLSIFLVANQTRMAWLTTMLVISALVFTRSNLKISLGFLFLIIFGFTLFLQIDHNVVNRGLSLRPEIWAESFNQIKDFWLFGKGIEGGIAIPVSGKSRMWYDTHNIYIEILYYTGVTGLFLLLIMMLKVANELGFSLRYSSWCLVWCVYVTFSGMADGGGLLARPNEQWFKIYLPIMFILAYCREKELLEEAAETS